MEMAKGWLLNVCYLSVFLIVTTVYISEGEANSDPCLRGFTQTIPPEEEWNSYEVLDVDGGSFLYPELMFTCSGTLTRIEIPYSTIAGPIWKNRLELDLIIWRKQREGGYQRKEGEIRVMEDIDSESSEKVTGIATSEPSIIIQKYDILQFTIEEYMGRDNKREHIPYLLTAYQPPGYTEPVIVPLIHVDFSGQPEEASTTVLPLPSITSSDYKSCNCPTSSVSYIFGQYQTESIATSQRCPSVALISTTSLSDITSQRSSADIMSATLLSEISKPPSKLLEPASVTSSSPGDDGNTAQTPVSTTQSSDANISPSHVPPVDVASIPCGNSNDNNGVIIALSAVLGLMVLIILGLCFGIGLIAVKGRTRHKGRPIKVGLGYHSTTNIRPPTNAVEESEAQFVAPVYDVASHVGTYSKVNNRQTYYNEEYGVAFAPYEESPYWQPGDTVKVIYEQIEQYAKISPSAVNKQQQLGEGEFGIVYKGQWKSKAGGMQTVALKTLKSTASNDERVKLLQEAAIMGQFTHPHIVTLYGVVKELDEPIMVMEFLEGGDLLEYLFLMQNKVRGQSADERMQLPSTLLRFCQEIADGMRYLSQKGFIHRDLAARNVLLTADIKCKIADFGMSRDLEEETYYKSKGGRIPVKWTAPEAIFYKRYTTKSDVWSYGMVVYEIWSLGHKPFEDLTVEEVIKVMNSKKNQPPPPGCPKGIYALMVQCWEPDPKKRITFDNIIKELCSDSAMILRWEDGNNTSSPLCSVLGAPLEHGHGLYKDLQNLYRI